MLSYELVKTLHILCAFTLISFSLLSLLAKSSRSMMIAYGIAGLATALMGFFLIGIMQKGMPHWMLGKFFIWLMVMAMVGIVNKRFPKYKTHAAWLLFGLTFLAIYLAVYKPG